MGKAITVVCSGMQEVLEAGRAGRRGQGEGEGRPPPGPAKASGSILQATVSHGGRQHQIYILEHSL